MNINIEQTPLEIKVTGPDAIVKLKARKNIAGDLFIYDHPDIDVVISPEKNKIIAFAKKEFGDHVYATQSRMFEYLARKGVVQPETIMGGNVFSSLEAKMTAKAGSITEDVSPMQIVLYSVAKFFEIELPEIKGYKDYEEKFDKSLTDPSDEDTTPLGKIPHEPRKGSNKTYPGTSAPLGLVGNAF